MGEVSGTAGIKRREREVQLGTEVAEVVSQAAWTAGGSPCW